MNGGFNNGDFNLKLPISKIKLCQIKALYSMYFRILLVVNLIGNDYCKILNIGTGAKKHTFISEGCLMVKCFAQCASVLSTYLSALCHIHFAINNIHF